MLYPDVVPAFEELRQIKDLAKQYPASPKLVVGVITNSDDRVPSVLSSLGIKVNPRRHGTPAQTLKSSEDGEDDVDFVVMSYDVGFEKPSRKIFDATRQVVYSGWGPKNQDDRYIHVGDDLEKDFKGAEQAWWESMLLDREGTHAKHGAQGLQAVSSIKDLRELRSYIIPDN